MDDFEKYLKLFYMCLCRLQLKFFFAGNSLKKEIFLSKVTRISELLILLKEKFLLTKCLNFCILGILSTGLVFKTLL